MKVQVQLVGNPVEHAVLENVGGLVVRTVRAVVVATDVEPVARAVPTGTVVRIPAGGRPWHYLAVRGGVVAEPVLGSRSTDVLGGLGPTPLRPGAVLSAGAAPSDAPTGEVAPVRERSGAVGVTLGPRSDWFVTGTVQRLTSAAWTVGEVSRVGVRLVGPTLERRRTGELPSEGLVRGAIQVPPDGRPIMMLADHPTTGGYPVVAVVDPDDVARVAQTPPGATVRFRLDAP